jgi:hypothetical protein
MNRLFTAIEPDVSWYRYTQDLQFSGKQRLVARESRELFETEPAACLCICLSLSLSLQGYPSVY